MGLCFCLFVCLSSHFERHSCNVYLAWSFEGASRLGKFHLLTLAYSCSQGGHPRWPPLVSSPGSWGHRPKSSCGPCPDSSGTPIRSRPCLSGSQPDFVQLSAPLPGCPCGSPGDVLKHACLDPISRGFFFMYLGVEVPLFCKRPR